LGERLLLRVRVSPTQQAAADAGSHQEFFYPAVTPGG